MREEVGWWGERKKGQRSTLGPRSGAIGGLRRSMFGERAAPAFASLMLRHRPFNWPGRDSGSVSARQGGIDSEVSRYTRLSPSVSG